MGGRGAISSLGRVPTANEIDALEAYVSGDMMYVNQYLRGLDGLDTSQLNGQEKDFIRDMDKMTSRDDLSGKTLYRSVDAEAVFGNISQTEYDNLIANVVYGDNQRIVANDANRLLNRAQGRTYTEAGYMSTSKDRSVAEDWGGFSGSSKPIVMEMHMGDGVKGADVNKHANSRMRMAEMSDPQKEVLLKRGRKVSIQNITTKNGQLVVVANVS